MSDGGRDTGSHSNILTIVRAQVGDGAVYQLGVTNLYSGGVPTLSTADSLYVETVPDFNTNGLGWNVFRNDTSGGPPFISGNVLTLTDNNGGEARAAWYQYPLYIGSFFASFTYQDVSIGGADGTAFVLQNDPRGTAAIGAPGGALAVSALTPPAEL